MTAGEEFDAICEEIVQAATRLQVRRRSLEEIDLGDQYKLIGALEYLNDHLQRRAAEIDAELSKILDAKMKQ